MSKDRNVAIRVGLLVVISAGCHAELDRTADGSADSDAQLDADALVDASADEEGVADSDETRDGDDERCEQVATAIRSIELRDLIVAQSSRLRVAVPGPHDGGLRLSWSVDVGEVAPTEGWEVEITSPASRTDIHVLVVVEGAGCRSEVGLVVEVRTAAEIDMMLGCLSEVLTWPTGVTPFVRAESTVIGDRFAVVLCIGPDIHARSEYLPVSMRVRNVGADVEGVTEPRPSCEFEVHFEGVPPPNNLGICDGLAVECDPPFGTETWSSGTTRASGNFYSRFGADEYSCGVLASFVHGAGEYVAVATYHGRLADGSPLVSEPLAIPFAVVP